VKGKSHHLFDVQTFLKTIARVVFVTTQNVRLERAERVYPTVPRFDVRATRRVRSMSRF
jgi:hypothetical protein